MGKHWWDYMADSTQAASTMDSWMAVLAPVEVKRAWINQIVEDANRCPDRRGEQRYSLLRVAALNPELVTSDHLKAVGLERSYDEIS